MTRLAANQQCESCYGMLVLPETLTGRGVPPNTDYVCIRCGRPYRWIGDPPRLATEPSVVHDEQTDDDRE
jgi:DNA-directed RNA polymerase subunit RPC12/RpoP